MSVADSFKSNWALALKEGCIQGSVEFPEKYLNCLMEFAPINSNTLQTHIDAVNPLIQYLKCIRNVYSTLEEKIQAYEDFFNSEESTLIVIGNGGSGKSHALYQAKKECDIILHQESNPILMKCKDGFPERLCTIYHFFETDIELAKELQKKFGARIIRFE